MLSALRFHELTTQLPFEVWMTIGVKAWTPPVDNPRMRFIRASGRAFAEGVQTHQIEGVPVRIYDSEKLPSHRAPTHLGEMLLEEFLKPMNLTQRQLADAIHVPYGHQKLQCSSCLKAGSWIK